MAPGTSGHHRRPRIGCRTWRGFGTGGSRSTREIIAHRTGSLRSREAFNYSYAEIADILELKEENTRQLVTRARKHIADGRCEPVSSAEHQRLLHVFIAAAQTGDLAALENLFASDVVSHSDGGGVVRASLAPVVGRTTLAKFISGVAQHFWTGATLEWIDANGQASVLVSRDGAVVAFATIHASSDGIDQLLWVMNPAKLAAISRLSQASR